MGACGWRLAWRWAVSAAELAAERWARRAGVAIRARLAPPVLRVPRPVRTPIYDSAVQAQREKGA